MKYTPGELKDKITFLIQEGNEVTSNFIHDVYNNETCYQKYQKWSSRALIIITQIQPDREKEIKQLISDTTKALTNSEQRYRTPPKHLHLSLLGILEACPDIVDDAVYHLRGIIRADLFETELDESEFLLKSGHIRAAGALAGVVIERNLAYACFEKSIDLPKKCTLGQIIKTMQDKSIIEDVEFHRLSLCNTIRIKCDHPKRKEPTTEEIQRLIDEARITLATNY